MLKQQKEREENVAPFIFPKTPKLCRFIESRLKERMLHLMAFLPIEGFPLNN
jgi:hypothetical protein